MRTGEGISLLTITGRYPRSNARLGMGVAAIHSHEIVSYSELYLPYFLAATRVLQVSPCPPPLKILNLLVAALVKSWWHEYVAKKPSIEVLSLAIAFLC
jgi:hypothetical protein